MASSLPHFTPTSSLHSSQHHQQQQRMDSSHDFEKNSPSASKNYLPPFLLGTPASHPQIIPTSSSMSSGRQPFTPLHSSAARQTMPSSSRPSSQNVSAVRTTSAKASEYGIADHILFSAKKTGLKTPMDDAENMPPSTSLYESVDYPQFPSASASASRYDQFKSRVDDTQKIYDKTKNQSDFASIAGKENIFAQEEVRREGYFDWFIEKLFTW